MPNVRRSLTIAEENDERVQQRRAMFLSIPKAPIDMDYTTAVNMLVELGDFLFKQTWTGSSIIVDRKGILDIVSKYLYSPTLKEQALIDQYQDQLLNNLPKMIDQYQKALVAQKQNLPTAQQTQQEHTSEMPKKDKQDKEYIR